MVTYEQAIHGFKSFPVLIEKHHLVTSKSSGIIVNLTF